MNLIELSVKEQQLAVTCGLMTVIAIVTVRYHDNQLTSFFMAEVPVMIICSSGLKTQSVLINDNATHIHDITE
jgi:hypothetical protein